MTTTEKDPAYRLAMLAAEARVHRPRLFAVHGIGDDGRAILGWGMEFQDREDAVFYLPSASVTHHTVSAERVAQRYAPFGEMHITWFDEDCDQEPDQEPDRDRDRGCDEG